MVRGRKPSKQEIIQGIKSAWEDGADLRTSAVQKNKYRSFYRSSVHYFKNWKEALNEAGITYKEVVDRIKDPQKEVEKELFFGKLREIYEQGVDLSASSLQGKDNPYSPLYHKAKNFHTGRFFWENTLKGAGLPMDKIVKQKRWDKDKVKLELIKRDKKGLGLNSTSIKDSKDGLYKAITHHFDSHEDALRYSGFNPKKIIKKGENRSKSDIIKKIIKFHIKGVDLNGSKILNGNKKSLKRIVWDSERKFDKGWPEAVETAGINYDGYREKKPKGFWDTEIVLNMIKDFHEKGISLNSGYIAKNHSDLHHAALRYVGGWENALLACGIHVDKVRLIARPLSEEEVIKEIKNLHLQGKDLNVGSMIEGDYSQRRIYFQAYKRFGDWDSALIKAEISPDSVRKKRKRYTLEELAMKIKQFESEGMDLSHSAIKDNPQTKRFLHAVSKRFDSWKNFLDKIGIDSEKYCRDIQDWREGKGVLNYLKENFQSGVVTGASKDRNFSAAVNRYFGTIPNAVEKAGLIYSRSGKISKSILEDPEVLGILYHNNLEFLESIAKKVFFSAHKFRKGRTMDIEDLTNEAFLSFIDILPEKPPKRGVREFVYEPVLKNVSKINKDFFKDQEILFAEEVYFDLFIDEDFD